MKNMILSLLAVLTIQSTIAMAGNFQQVTPYGKTGWYNTGNTLTHNFDQPTYVERMLISAEGNRNFAKAYVYADGDLVSVLGVPGQDPDYPVIVRKSVSAIVIKFEGQIRIIDFRMYVSADQDSSDDFTDQSGLNTPAELGQAVLNVVSSLQETVSYTNFNHFILPLRKSAIVLAAKGRGRPLLSSNTQAQARVMIAQIKHAESFLMGHLAYSDAYTNRIQTLMFVKEKLEAIYEIN